MLKILPIISGSQPNVKCAEVFYQTPMNFKIICTFCEMKSFEFDDFLLHFKNVHFENNLLKTEELECTSFLNISIKNEAHNSEEVNKECLKSVPTASDNMAKSVSTHWKIAESSSSYESDGDEWKVSNHNDCNEDDEDEEYKPKKRRSIQENNKFQCDQCKKFYKTEGILKHHIRKYHKDDKSVARHQCNHCSKVLSNVRQLSAHMVNEHEGFKCKHCDKKFRANYKLKRHEVTHTGVKDFVCDFENCGKRFFTQHRLTDHRHIHADPKNFVCEKCGYSCRNNAMLKVHYRTHTGEKPYSCNLCDKRFASASILNEHKPIHSTERPHICDVCGATFSRPKALYHHKHLHLGIKKFKCKLCGNAYAQAAGLAGHMRQHKQSAMVLSVS